MTARTAWLAIAIFVALTAWLLLGAVLTVTHQIPREWTPQTVAPAVPASIEGATP